VRTGWRPRPYVGMRGCRRARRQECPQPPGPQTCAPCTLITSSAPACALTAATRPRGEEAYSALLLGLLGTTQDHLPLSATSAGRSRKDLRYDPPPSSP
jgi:hypothetical protein